ncbi:hypothetical protein NPIL_54811 [Nephila pilipes]|uniref:Uncharacterized protein n=1 Tax=Nephila pilipes TaxID=299642 RepID=A0A8X6NZL5_NEPPI|nr:hypothetical protein NPIL_54811 [Nephila pilipes]
MAISDNSDNDSESMHSDSSSSCGESERQNNTNIHVLLVLLRKSPEAQDIYNISNVGYFKSEDRKKNTMPVQLYRCQDFYHHNSFRNRTPKCLKGDGSYFTRNCKKSLQIPPKCPLFGGPHSTNFSG